ncbi:hypothetical protein BKA63DRAFT_70270 [Paraphoma chrysanthemicola]|nr:hypothetical protein BKA63DRAFT_70270 [Paraphoma chrysanthemicola]
MPGFLNLPTELRLEVYRILIEKCLWDGHVSDIAGLYRCCREVHKELEAEYIAKIRPVLQAKSKWQTKDSPDGPLRMKISPSLKATPGEGDLTIMLSFNGRKQYYKYKHSSAVGVLAGCLSPVLAAPWATVTICPSDSVSQIRSARRIDIFKNLSFMFIMLICGYDRSSGNLLGDIPKTRQLKFHYGYGTHHLCPYTLEYMSAINYTCREAFLRDGSMAKGAKSWIVNSCQGEQQGWQQVFDFDEDTAAGDGALWEMLDNGSPRRFRNLVGGTENSPFR